MRIHGVDTIRAFAALSVMLAHIVGPSLPGALKYTFTGYPAVFAFFVISGFCIHVPYTRQPLPVLSFLAARAIRILVPSAVAIWLAGRLHIEFFNFRDGYILWSIVCELWYYALYPVFYVLTRWVSWRQLCAIAFVIATVFVVLSGADAEWNFRYLGYDTFHYFHGPWLTWIVGLPAWLLGCVLAQEYTAQRSRFPIYGWRILVALTASALAWLTAHTDVHYQFTMNPFAILVFFWMRAEIAAATRVTWLDRIGVWSFSIYLFHVIAEAFLHRATDVVWLVLPAVFLLCYGFYMVVERPSHKAARLFYGAHEVKAFTVQQQQ